MYVWNESIASRGAQEIGSCLFRHLSSNVPQNTEKIILYSDSCGGQNRNIKVALMLKKFLADRKLPVLQSIDQRFFVSGHSYNSCDRCFGTIEKQKKITENIFVPEHWVNIIQQAKKKDPPFTVIEMTKEHFYSSESLEKIIVNRKTFIDGTKISWFSFQSIHYDCEDLFILKIKEFSSNSNRETKQISLEKNNSLANFDSVILNKLYKQERCISQTKFNDLQHLLKYVPVNYQYFYTNLKYIDDDSKLDFSLANDNLSSDEDD